MINLPAPGYHINFNLPDSVAHFEVIENNNFDTLSTNGGVFLIHKKLVVTSFDSGAWYIPSFEVFVERNNSSQKFNTDSLLVNVGYSPSDSTNELRDIKPVMEVTVTDYFWFYVAAIVLGVMILAFLFYRYLKNRKKKPAPLFHSTLSPYQEAMRSLDELKKLDLGNATDIKLYHSSLAEIFKKYYSRKLNKNVLNKTTSDVLLSVKEQGNTNLLSSVAEFLRAADAVKFAKYLPALAESNESMQRVKTAIDLLEKDDSQIKNT